jgi:hypothetical protein
MKITPAKRFEASCRKWQVTLGLTDWTLHFKTAKADGAHEAMVEYNGENRHATITFFVGVKDALVAERVALHEMLHVLFADMLTIAAKRASDGHADVLLEEHRVIERLLNALDGRP